MALNNMKKLGIVGYGKIGAKHHKVFAALGAKVVASCNRSEAGREKAKQAGVPSTYASYIEMIEQEELDALICSTSIFTNFEVTKKLIPYKIPLLLEKPPGTSIEELETHIQLQEEYGTLVMLATNRIWYSVLRKAVADIGGLDNIEGVEVMWSENPKSLKENRGFSDEQIKSRNFSNSIHGFSIFQYLCGDLENIHASGHRGKNEFDWNMSLQGVSKRGVVGRFVSSWQSILPWRVSFYGHNKIYDFAPLEKCTCTNLLTRDQKIIEGEEFDKEQKAGFYLQGKHFLAALIDKNIPNDATLQNARSLFKYANAVTECFVSSEGICKVR